MTPFVRLSAEGALEVAALADQTPSVWLCEPGADAPDGCAPAEHTRTDGAVTTWSLPACPGGRSCEVVIPFDPAYPPVKLPFGLDPGA